MSNETKREVLEKLAECYAEVSDAYTEKTGSPYYCDDEPDYIDEYDTALPDDLPVIPEAVGEYIKNLWKYHRDLVDVFGMVRDLGITRTEPNGVLIWVAHNTDAFAHAWVLGVWRVEETGEIVKLEAEK